jgi:hypothetical protein
MINFLYTDEGHAHAVLKNLMEHPNRLRANYKKLQSRLLHGFSSLVQSHCQHLSEDVKNDFTAQRKKRIFLVCEEYLATSSFPYWDIFDECKILGPGFEDASKSLVYSPNIGSCLDAHSSLRLRRWVLGLLPYYFRLDCREPLNRRVLRYLDPLVPDWMRAYKNRVPFKDPRASKLLGKFRKMLNICKYSSVCFVFFFD